MTQEAIMIAIDNSDFMRNGDYNPSRHQAQIEAFNYFCSAKKRNNVENTCGLMTLVKNHVVCTLTPDVSKLQSKITLVELGGIIKFGTTVRVAQLALRHRQSRNQKPRIVVFVGSSLTLDDADDLVKLAKKLKKDRIAVDIVSFGESEDNQEKLTSFIDTINGKDNTSGNSHLVTIPPGSNLQESLRTSPILMTDDVGTSGAVGGGFGINDMDDPDLAYAIRVSMEDQRMQQERAVGLNDETASGTVPGATPGDTTEEAMLREAMAASLTGETPVNNADTPAQTPTNTEANSEMMVDLTSMTEEEQIAYAMRMSLQDSMTNAEMASSSAPTVTEDDKLMETDCVEEPKSDSQATTTQEKFDVVENPELIDAVLEQMDDGEDNTKEDSTKQSGGDN